MADGAVALQAFDDRVLGEIVADQSDVALVVELVAVVADDAGRLLAAVLERVQPQRREGAGVLVSEYAENTAFLVQFVRIEGVRKSDLAQAVSLTCAAVAANAAAMPR